VSAVGRGLLLLAGGADGGAVVPSASSDEGRDVGCKEDEGKAVVEPGDDGGTTTLGTLSTIGPGVLVGAEETEGNAVAPLLSKTEGNDVAVGVEEEDGATEVSSVISEDGM
jgi:hypothetical protein